MTKPAIHFGQHALFWSFAIAIPTALFSVPAIAEKTAEKAKIDPDAQSLIEASDRFTQAAQMALNVDLALVNKLTEIQGLHGKIGETQSAIEQIQQRIKEIDDTPLPPVTPPPPQSQGAGGGSGDGGGSGGGGDSGGGLETPQMAQLPAASAFQLPEAPQDVTPDFGDALNFKEKDRAFTPSSPTLSAYTPQPLALPQSKAPSTEGAFAPAALAAGAMPKLKNLDSLSAPSSNPPAAGGGGDGAAAGGAMGGMGGGGPMSLGGGGGGDGASLNNVGYEPPYDSASGIVVRDPGYGSGGGEGGSSAGSEGSGYGDGASKVASNPTNQIFRGLASKSTGRYQRTRADGAEDNSIFGKLSLWLDDSCGFLPSSKENPNRPPICNKALANELAMSVAEEAQPYEGSAEKVLNQKPAMPEAPSEKKKPLPPGVREIASAGIAQTENTSPAASELYMGQAPQQRGSVPNPVSNPAVPKTTAPVAQDIDPDDILKLIRAGVL
jgi:hypothetical protein